MGRDRRRGQCNACTTGQSSTRAASQYLVRTDFYCTRHVCQHLCRHRQRFRRNLCDMLREDRLRPVDRIGYAEHSQSDQHAGGHHHCADGARGNGGDHQRAGRDCADFHRFGNIDESADVCTERRTVRHDDCQHRYCDLDDTGCRKLCGHGDCHGYKNRFEWQSGV